MSKSEKIASFKKFINDIKPKDRVAVIHHTDCDGICSGYIIIEALERLSCKPVLELPLSANSMNSSLTKFLKQNGITKSICVDLAIDQNSKVVENISRFSDILIIDHHKIYNEFKSKNILLIKHYHLGITKYYPASKLAYDLFSEVVDISDLDWISAAGVIGDSGFPQNKKFVAGVMRKYNVFPAQDLFTTDLGKVAMYLGAAGSVVPDRIKQALSILKKAKKPKDVLDSDLASVAKEIEEEIVRQIKLFKKKSEKHGDLMIGEIESKHRVKSAVVTRLSIRELPHKTLVILQKNKDRYIVSARRHDKKLAVNDLLEGAVEDLIFADAGGHVPAAGGSIRAEDLDKFKENLIKKHEKLKRK